MNCVLCGKAMEPVEGGDYQPYGGGEICLVFAYGSCKFDCYPGFTEYQGAVCDDCATPLVSKMDCTGHDLNGQLIKGGREPRGGG